MRSGARWSGAIHDSTYGILPSQNKRGSKRQAFRAGKGDADEQQQETSVVFAKDVW